MEAVAPESPQAPCVTEAVANVAQPARPGRVTPLAPERYGVQFTMDQETRELLEKAKELSSDPAARKLENVFKRALALLVRDLERRRCAATDNPRVAKRPKSSHTVTQNVKRQVRKRDQGQAEVISEPTQ
jgi:hypothetical protein